MDIRKLEKYSIKKGKTDIVSSLKNINKNLLNERIEEYGFDSVEELAKDIIEEFEMILNSSKSDVFTQMFFQRLVSNENSMIFSAYEQDVEEFNVFVYKKGEHYSYYIPDEIRKIIKQELGI